MLISFVRAVIFDMSFSSWQFFWAGLADARKSSIKYFVPEATVTAYDNENRYIVELDSSGKVRLEIVMPPGSSGDTIPEEEYRAVFREIFGELGLDQEAVGNFEFFHSSSRIW